MKLILGSSSKWRQQVLREHGYTFSVMTAGIDEGATLHKDPEQLAISLARAKSQKITPNIHEPALLITSDQVIAWNDRILGKPKDADEAHLFLRGYASYAPETVTALIVTNTNTGRSAEGIDRVCVQFDPVPDRIVDALIVKGDIFTAAGGFQVQDPLLAPYVHYDGSRESCMGMPIPLLEKLMREVVQ